MLHNTLTCSVVVRVERERGGEGGQGVLSEHVIHCNALSCEHPAQSYAQWCLAAAAAA